MANFSGQCYGLNVLSPVILDPDRSPSHEVSLREELNALPRDERSPFSRMANTHLCRLQVMEDFPYPGHPSKPDHLRSSYLVFEANIDGPAEAFFLSMATTGAPEIDRIWSHCTGYPGIADPKAFAEYMERCRLDTNFFFADVNDKTVLQAMRALQVKDLLGDFVAAHQTKRGAALKAAFEEFAKQVEQRTAPRPGQPLP